LISLQASKGNRREWDFNISEAYLIALLEDIVLEGGTINEYLHDILARLIS
jgi:hypothetical protein